MTEAQLKAVKDGLPTLLERLWRYGLVLSKDSTAAENLVQATCVRALERSTQFEMGTSLDRWLFTILNSIWKNDLRSQKVRQGQGFADPETELIFDGVQEIETNILATQVLTDVQALPEAQRETVFLVYVEGWSYKQAAEVLEVPVGTIMSRLATARTKLGQLQENRRQH